MWLLSVKVLYFFAEAFEQPGGGMQYELPSIVFWNLDARQNNIPMLDGRFSYISGLSPIMIEQVLSGLDGYDLMLDKLMSKRYQIIGE